MQVFNKFPPLLSFGISMVLLFTVVNCSTETKQAEQSLSKESLIATAMEVDSLYLVAYNNGDVDALMKLHWNSPSLLAYPPGEMRLEGYDAVKASYAKEFAASKGARLEYLTVHNIPYTDVVVGHGTYKWTLPVESGSPIVVEGRYSDTKAFKDGKMVIMFDHSSVLPSPAAPDTTQVK